MKKDNAQRNGIMSILSSVLAHPFIITLIASGVLVYVGEGVKDYYGKKQNQYSYLTEVTNKKHIMLTKFTSAFDKEIAVLYNVKLKQVWLANPANQIDPIGRSRKELIAFVEKMWSTYEKEHDSQSLLIQITALFDNPSIIDRANNLRRLITDFQGTDHTKRDARKEIYAKVEVLYKEMDLLTKDMGSEIKTEIKRHTSNI